MTSVMKIRELEERKFHCHGGLLNSNDSHRKRELWTVDHQAMRSI